MIKDLIYGLPQTRMEDSNNRVSSICKLSLCGFRATVDALSIQCRTIILDLQQMHVDACEVDHQDVGLPQALVIYSMRNVDLYDASV
jgi:hypothetical protein